MWSALNENLLTSKQRVACWHKEALRRKYWRKRTFQFFRRFFPAPMGSVCSQALAQGLHFGRGCVWKAFGSKNQRVANKMGSTYHAGGFKILGAIAHPGHAPPSGRFSRPRAPPPSRGGGVRFRSQPATIFSDPATALPLSTII